MKHKILSVVLFLLIPSMIFCRISTKIRGQIMSGENNIPVPYARITFIETKKTTLTDEQGYFVIERDSKNTPIEIAISCLGYKEKLLVFDADESFFVISLEPQPIIIPGMTVKSKKGNVLTLSHSNISVILPENADVFDTKDLITQHPDIAIEENAMGERSIRIMGYESRHVALLVDGVKVNNPAMNTLRTIPLEQIDHIEVLTGNSSSAAGNAAMGGAINFVTKNPDNKFSYNTMISAGSWDSYSMNLQTSLPLIGASNIINIYAHKAANDFLYYNTQEEKDIRRINNDITEGSASIKSSFSLSKNISSTFSCQVYKAEKGIPGQATDYMWYEHARAHAERLEFKEIVSLKLSETQHEFVLSYQNSKSHYSNDITNVFFAYDAENISSIFDATWQLDHIISSCRSRLKSGYQHETYSYEDNLDPSQKISLKIRKNIFASYESSIPVHLLNSNLSIIPSLRFDTLMNENSFLSSNLTIEFPRDPERLQMTISGGNSYTMPEFTSLFWKGDSRVQGNPDLKPERSLGGKTNLRWQSKKFSFTVTGSYNRIDDLIYWYRSAMGVWKPENLADAELYGFSGSVEWTPIKQLSLSLTGSKVFPINNTTDSDHFDKYIPHNPLHKLRSEIEISLLPIELSLSVTNLGKQYDNFSNTVIVNGYTVCDAGISYHADLSNKYSLQIHAGIRNLFDDPYETSRNIPAPGRSFECSCKLIFK